MEYRDIVFVIVELILCIFLFWFASFTEKKKSSKLKLAWLAPAAAAAAFFIPLSGFDISLITVYLAVIILAAGFFSENSKLRRIVAAAGAVLIASAVIVCTKSGIYRRADYVRDFENIFEEAEKRYVLTKHKSIDWKALHDKYLPAFRKANKDNDAVENYIQWNRLCAEFHDGHVNYFSNKSGVREEAEKRASGYDYGMVTMKLSDGRYVALSVDRSLEKYGIHQLTEITSWDGMTLDEAAERSVLRQMQGFPDIDNELFYKAVFAGGTGGDTVKVTYINDEGEEVSAELHRLGGCYFERMKECLDTIDQSYPAANMTLNKVNDTTACIRICGMLYDSKTTKEENYYIFQRSLEKQLLEYKEQGIKDIILDIRGNSGGDDGIVSSIARLLALEGEHFYANDPMWDTKNNCYELDENGNYVVNFPYRFEGEDIMDGGKIIILVNSQSVSAADHLTKIMSQFDNVTVMGFTEPNGSAQGISIIDGEQGSIILSTSALLDENGNIFIDSGTDRQSGDDLDIKIPFDEKAVNELFDKGNDYLLDKALELLE